MKRRRHDETLLTEWARVYESADALRKLDAKGQVYLDAHVMSTPVLADVDGDGATDLVFSVSYFIEEEEATK